MALRLTIENETALPDGGPLSVEVTGQRGIDIGRDQYLDWCLPDPNRTISGKHCEIRYRDGGYWLHDVSRNGTFVNRNPQRLQEPYRLRQGDRIEIGHYIVAVQIDGESAAQAAPGFVPGAAPPDQYWASTGDAAPSISPRDLRPAQASRPVNADFIDWAVDVPPPGGGFAPIPAPAPSRQTGPAGEDMSWAQAAIVPPAPLPPPVPAPRRPSAPSGDGAAAWAMPPEPAGASPDQGWESPAPAPPAAPSDNPWGTPGLAAKPARPAEEAAPAGMPPPGPDLEASRAPPPPPPPAFEPPRAPEPPGRPADAPPSAPAGPPPNPADLLARFAKGAGIPVETFAWRDPGDLAEEIGGLVRLSTESLKQLLNARAETKRVARTANQTMIQALDNNPLKFSPTIEDALRIMFGRPSAGYLDARRALEQGFRDLKTHQVKTYSAMQHAIRILLHELDPDAIARSHEGDKGIGGLIGSKKARLWDLYLTRWDTLTAPHEDGMVDAFMLFFAECYDRGDKGR